MVLRHIIHLDMDAFYASVEVLDNPDLKGKPVIVGGTRGRGVVSAASYEAREFGVHSAQPVATAQKLCPHGIFIPPRLSRYKVVSDQIFEIFRRYTPLVEPLSLDEAFLDVTGSVRLFGSPTKIAQEIRALVKKEIGLTVSAGVAPTKMAAKIASDMDKPDGLTVVPDRGVSEFLAPLPISKLWGVGRATQKELRLLGVETFGDLARISEDVLKSKLGVHGHDLIRLARGEDDRSVNPEREVKSIGAEETLLKDLTKADPARRELLWLATKVTRRLRRHGFVARTVTLKVKYSDFKMITRSETLKRPTDESREVYQAVCRLLEETAVGRRPVRLLGVSLSKLGIEGEERQFSLLEDLNPRPEARQLNQALDRIADKFGDRAVLPASLLERE